MARILIVDDDPHQRCLYREEFRDAGHDVFEAADGREAIAAVPAVHPDAVVLDIGMPRFDGLDALARIHELDPRLPVVINSAHADYRDRFICWLADAYVTKSSRLDDLHTAVRDVLASRGVA